MRSLLWPILRVRSVGTFQDRGRWLVPTLALLVALGIGGAMAAKPAWRYVRARRAMRMVAEAETLAAQNKWTEVAPLMKSGLLLAPGNLRCYRLAARYYAAMGSSQALVYWRQVLGSGTATYEERRGFAEIAVAMGRPDLARPMLAELSKEKPGDMELQRIALGLARRVKMDDLVVQSAERWMRLDPMAPEPQYELGTLRWRSTNAAVRAEGRRLLWGLAYASNTFTLPAIGVLAGASNLNRAEVDLLWNRLDRLASTNRIGVAEARLRLRPSERSAVVSQVVGLLKPEAAIADVAVVLKWLADHGALAETLPLLTPERLARMPELEMVRVEALVELGRGAEIQAILDSPPKNVPKYLINCIRAVSAQLAGKPEQMSQHLDQAVATAGKSLTANLAVARFAEKLQQPRVALSCWQQIARDFGGGMDASMQIVRLARQVDELPASLPALVGLRNQMTLDVGVVLSADYVEALLGQLRPDLMPQLREIARTNAPLVHITAVLALAEWKTGDPAAALRVVESTGTDWATVEARYQAIYVGVLGAAGQREAARLAARKVSREGLSREEKALVEPWL